MTDRITPEGPVGPAAIALEALDFRWPARTDFRLQVPEFYLPQGQHAFLQGPSGSGKSTLLGLLAGLMSPDAGQIRLAGTPIERLSRRHRDRFRAQHLGIIFQQFNLVPYLSPLNNVLLPCRFSRERRHRAGPNPRETARELLSDLGLDPERLGRDVRALSIGQQQRVAAARALIGQPEIILADEPTSALDAEHRDRFIELLLTSADAYNGSVVLVSHDPALRARFGQIHDIRDWTGREEVLT